MRRTWLLRERGRKLKVEHRVGQQIMACQREFEKLEESLLPFPPLQPLSPLSADGGRTDKPVIPPKMPRGITRPHRQHDYYCQCLLHPLRPNFEDPSTRNSNNRSVRSKSEFYYIWYSPRFALTRTSRCNYKSDSEIILILHWNYILCFW